MWLAVRSFVVVLMAALVGMLLVRECTIRAEGTVPGAAAVLTPATHDNVPNDGFRLDVTGNADGNVALAWRDGQRHPAVEYVFRSTRSLDGTHLDAMRYPITREEVRGTRWVDTHAADHVTYYYQIAEQSQSSVWRYSNVQSLQREDRPLPPLTSPSIWVDKHWYVLEVRDGDRVAKRYPIALGHNPWRRKLHQDNASTPEGVYRIVGVQPQATYFKAYDIDYPNACDQLRYSVARDAGRLPSDHPSIGGEIQIHGKGIDYNWTWGCMALRNDDMVELFAHPEIAEGVTVRIVGSELSADDLALFDQMTTQRIRDVQQCLKGLSVYGGAIDGQMSEATMRALGQFQLAHNLPLTCQLDKRTLVLLGMSK